MGADIKDFFLQTPLPPEDQEYMRIHVKYFDEEIRKLYNINELADKDGYVYCKIMKGMYGLKQAAILAFKQLKQRLEKHGYEQLPTSTGLWKHKTRNILFALCVDDFSIKYFKNTDDVEQLLTTLRKYSDITTDKTGKNYCSLTFNWKYEKGYVDAYIPDFVLPALTHFDHPTPKHPQHSLHRWNQPLYGRKTQYAPPPDTSQLLDKKGQRKVQSICGKFLYYGRAVDPTIMVSLNDIGTQQAKPTRNTLKDTAWLMDFLHTYPNAWLRFFAGDMQLAGDLDAAYLVMPGAKSRYEGHFYLESKPNKYNKHAAPHNAPVHTECKALRNIVCSTAEVETGGLFHNGQFALVARTLLEEMGHKQHKPTALKTDNSTANSFVHSTMRVKRSKTWDMRYHWLQEKAVQKAVHIFWDKGINNYADYFTKHHSPAHHQLHQSWYVLKGYNVFEQI